MKINICDRCGEKIEGYIYKITIEKERLWSVYSEKKELCIKCLEEIEKVMEAEK